MHPPVGLFTLEYGFDQQRLIWFVFHLLGFGVKKTSLPLVTLAQPIRQRVLLFFFDRPYFKIQNGMGK